MKKAVIAALAAGLIVTCGCSKKQSADNVEPAVARNDVTQTVQNVQAPVAPSLPELEISAVEWADASNAFGLNILRKTSGNAVFSPYSAQRALGMVYDGAAGATAEQMRTALSMPLAKNLSAAGVAVENDMLANVKKDLDGAPEGEERIMRGPELPEVRIDNRVWLEKTYEILPGFAESLEKYYRVEPVPVDFIQGYEAARVMINDDIARSTNDKIRDLIPPRALNELTRLVLTNAVYFKAEWRNRFDKEATAKEKFYAADGEKEVDMMHHTKNHRIFRNGEVTVLVMDFTGTYSLAVVLPNVEDMAVGTQALQTVESAMDAALLRKYIGEAQAGLVRLGMPKFRIEYSASLSKMLKSLGMTDAFADQADFSRISPERDLKISDVIQKAYIDVNENGAEAAAATAVIMATRAMIAEPEEPVEVTVDHPFLYALVENTSGAALFLGRVTTF